MKYSTSAIIVTLAISVLRVRSQSFDLGDKVKQCLEDGRDRNYCTEQIMEDFRGIMKTGVPDLDLPPLDPLDVPKINFKFFDAMVEFNDAQLKGFYQMVINYSKVDPVKK